MNKALKKEKEQSIWFILYKVQLCHIDYDRYTDDTTLMAESKELKSLNESERGE